MRKLSLFLAALLALGTLGFVGCGGSTGGGSTGGGTTGGETTGGGTTGGETTGGGTTDDTQDTNMLFDPKFEKGIGISALQSNLMQYTEWNYGSDTQDDHFWRLGQYGDLSTTRTGYDSSKNDLFPGVESIFGDEPALGVMETKSDGTHTLTSQSGSKQIGVNTQTGTVSLNVNTTKEYINQSTNKTQKRVDGEDWVHMILSQQAGTVRLSQVSSFVMELDFTLTKSTIYDTSIGAAQFQWIFSVNDPDSSYGDYFWFNVCLYDNRYEKFPGTQMVDSGKADATGKFIYAPTGEELFGESGGKVEVGVKYHVRLDLLEYMENAFTIAKSKGALKDSSWESMTVTSFNLGWEVSNLADVGVDISNLALYKVDKA
ncbi:MAG: hypothetical protein IJ329_02410 [Clostridia bacterium]|nr:hypothetical protein [Clostridia bacterium]